MANLDAAEREVYRRGLAAYMSSGNRPKTSQHAWAMARVKSAFGKREAAKIRAKKKKVKRNKPIFAKRIIFSYRDGNYNCNNHTFKR